MDVRHELGSTGSHFTGFPNQPGVSRCEADYGSSARSFLEIRLGDAQSPASPIHCTRTARLFVRRPNIHFSDADITTTV
jgi:hypothetical protein